MNKSSRIHNLIAQGIISIVNYIKLSARYDNKKKLYYN